MKSLKVFDVTASYTCCVDFMGDLVVIQEEKDQIDMSIAQKERRENGRLFDLFFCCVRNHTSLPDRKNMVFRKFLQTLKQCKDVVISLSQRSN